LKVLILLIRNQMDELINEFKISTDQEELDLQNTKLCRAIYLAMKEKGLTQNDLAEKMQVDKSLISRWLGGVHFMGADTLFRIGKALGIDIINQDFLKPKPTNEYTEFIGWTEYDLNIKLISASRILGNRMTVRGKRKESKKTTSYSGVIKF
jgi:transcriptional regulator with XRE-family HTH domain